MAPNARSLSPLLLVSITLVPVVGIFLWLQFGSQKTNFVIEGVPPVTIYNHTGENAYVVTDLAAALVSVLKYYGEDLSVSDIQTINRRFFDDENPTALHQLDDIKVVAEGLGYSATIEVPKSIDDFRKYFDPDTPTPVIFSHLMEIGQHPAIRFRPMGVLIGMLDKEQAVVVHDYYFGYNKKISYSDFGKLGAYPAQVLVIKPKISGRIQTSAVPAYTRTPSMDKVEPLINSITLARVAQGQKLYAVAAEYYRKSLANPDFEAVVPPYYKVVALNGGTNSYIRLEKDYESALRLARQAETLNHDLDEPFGDFWPGFVDGTNLVTDQYPSIYYWLGRIYEHNKDYAKALTSYEKALQVYPYGPSKSALEKLRLQLNK